MSLAKLKRGKKGKQKWEKEEIGEDRSLLQKSPIKETHILQKRPAGLKSQLIIATP